MCQVFLGGKIEIINENRFIENDKDRDLKVTRLQKYQRFNNQICLSQTLKYLLTLILIANYQITN